MPNLNLEAELNRPQIQAVTTIDGPVLIIAGAGSGKTRVITYRIAHMLEQGIPQQAILALTFTNKAATEMETRVKELTKRKLQALTINTFHAFGVRLLRAEIETLGYRKNFSIYDETDRTQALKDALRECKVSPDGIDMYAVGQLFSNIKIGRAQWGKNANTAYKPVYEEYQHSLKVYNAVDFDDLLVLPIELFEHNPEILKKYREHYRYIMVDEFQDTSHTQYQIMRYLAGHNVCVVGDDDQSIYSWRGANYENIQRFEQDYPDYVEIKLEQNYRSTTTILEAANGVISNNANRKEKRLWSGNGSGKPIEIVLPANESLEADYIANKIQAIRTRENLKYDEFGVLVRTNSLMTPIEEAFLAADIPYVVSGGTSFFARKEIKDILSYLRLIANTDDDVNLLRIINTPRRGIGKAAIERLAAVAKEKQSSQWDAMASLRYAGNTLFQETARAEIDEFMTLIEKEREELLGKRGLSAKVRALVDTIDYWSYLVTEHNKNEKLARWKFLNIQTLIQSIETWERNPDNFDPTLYPYLNRISLITRDTGDDGADKGKVSLSTIHASKGLEFPVVFIAGVEEGIIPHARSIEDTPYIVVSDTTGGDGGGAAVEEERRLFYVAITRARDKLFITSCQKRKRGQTSADRAPSPFIAEIPANLVEYSKDEMGAVTEADEKARAEDFFKKMKARFTM
jgi:DNA helicase-2/ATP-dependent DNA helicase PcrA